MISSWYCSNGEDFPVLLSPDFPQGNWHYLALHFMYVGTSLVVQCNTVFYKCIDTGSGLDSHTFMYKYWYVILNWTL